MEQANRLPGAQRAIAVMFFNLGFGYANWLARIPAVRDRLQLDDQQLGLLLLAGGLGALVAFRMAPAFIRRFGTRRVGTAGSAIFGLLAVLPAVAPTGPLAALGLFCAGWFNGLMDVALNAQAVEIEKQRARPILSTLHGCFSLGGFCGAAAGAGAAYAGIVPSVHLGTMGVLLFLLSAYVGRWLLQDPEQAADPAAAALAAPAAVAAPTGNRTPRALILLGTVACCSSVGEGAMAEWTAIYLRDILATSMTLAAAGYAAFSLAMVTGRFLGDHINLNISPRTVLMACGGTAAASLGLGLWLPTPAAFILGTMGVGCGLSLVIPVVLRVAVTVPNIPAPRALSTMATLSYGGFLLGPPLIGMVSHQLGLRLAMGVVVLAALLLAALAARVPENQAEPLPGVPCGPVQTDLPAP